MAPERDLERVRGAQARLEDAIAGLDDTGTREASLLPGWTVGHVLTHLARNADSHRRRADAAGRGEVVEQYPGGAAGRAAEIDGGAGRSADELRRDVETSAEALSISWAILAEDAWERPTLDVMGRERPLHDLVGRRWQELEVHGIDLGIGLTPRWWSADFVHDRLPVLRMTLPGRLGPGARAPEAATLDERDELAWLYGRLHRADLPELAPWD